MHSLPLLIILLPPLYGHVEVATSGAVKDPHTHRGNQRQPQPEHKEDLQPVIPVVVHNAARGKGDQS